MDSVADVEELQGPECRRGAGQEAEVHKPAGPYLPPGPRSGLSFGRGTSRAAPCGSLVLGLQGSPRTLGTPAASGVRPHGARLLSDAVTAQLAGPDARDPGTAISSSSSIASLLPSGRNKFTDVGNYANTRSVGAFAQGKASMSDHYDLSRRAKPAGAFPLTMPSAVIGNRNSVRSPSLTIGPKREHSWPDMHPSHDPRGDQRRRSCRRQYGHRPQTRHCR